MKKHMQALIAEVFSSAAISDASKCLSIAATKIEGKTKIAIYVNNTVITGGNAVERCHQAVQSWGLTFCSVS